MLSRIILAFVSLAVVIVSGCAQQPPVPPLNISAALPDISARYITERHHAHDDKEDHATHTDDADVNNEWLFWRTAQRIEVSIPRQLTGEVWLKDGKALFYQKLFHADHKIVEYQNADLDALNVGVNWQTNQLMIDPLVLQQLKVVDERWIDTHPALELAGTVSGIHYQVTWLVDLNAPYRLEKHDQAGNSELTTLQEIHVDTAALAAPDSRNYEIIDYADLGDRERDPFVLKVQSHLVGGHWHSH